MQGLGVAMQVQSEDLSTGKHSTVSSRLSLHPHTCQASNSNIFAPTTMTIPSDWRAASNLLWALTIMMHQPGRLQNHTAHRQRFPILTCLSHAPRPHSAAAPTSSISSTSISVWSRIHSSVSRAIRRLRRSRSCLGLRRPSCLMLATRSPFRTDLMSRSSGHW